MNDIVAYNAKTNERASERTNDRPTNQLTHYDNVVVLTRPVQFGPSVRHLIKNIQ
jgi:hypothetical protein